MKKFIVAVIICSLLVACGGRMTKKKSLDHSLYQYAKVMRWADYNTALTFFSPNIDKEHKPTVLEIERLKQFNVSSYVAAPIMPGASENEIIQDVQIKLYNLHTKRERVVVDRQVWEYDSDAKTWWLTSGLPQLVTDR
ncbi:hypothetical protein [Marinicella litoralis]|uniref:Uncharacterized protein n=1 Tax=Marinicella litoralis TaxID=644220 RepID=A0A4R6XLM7_9GAMM|nr:hypothetical protein [Marinicella litoralis]TDR20535.1 hypothetical protein C8D91_1509 [Marinicella litoralis]